MKRHLFVAAALSVACESPSPYTPYPNRDSAEPPPMGDALLGPDFVHFTDLAVDGLLSDLAATDLPSLVDDRGTPPDDAAQLSTSPRATWRTPSTPPSMACSRPT
jgi:hypothetical protein